jgi:hypothetical protein
MNDLKDINTNKDLLSSLDNNNDENNNNIEDEIEEKEIVFRNYIPQDRNFKIEKCYKMDEVKSIEEKIKQNVLKSVKEFLNLEKNNNLVKPPKKDYDLKRNIAQKMNYLNGLTNEAIKELAENKNKNKNE